MTRVGWKVKMKLEKRENRDKNSITIDLLATPSLELGTPVGDRRVLYSAFTIARGSQGQVTVSLPLRTVIRPNSIELRSRTNMAS